MDTSVFFHIAAAADNFALAAEKAPHLFGADEMRGILTAAFNLCGEAAENAAKESRRAHLEERDSDDKIYRASFVAGAALDFVRERFNFVENLAND